MTLRDWIVDLTPTKVSEIVEMDIQTVYQWRDLKSVPKPETMLKIVRITHGLVDYKDIIEPFFDAKEATL